MKSVLLLLLSCLFSQAGELLISDGTNSITKAEYIKSLCLIDSLGEEDLVRRAGLVGTNAVPVLLEILDTPNDPRLQSAAITLLGGMSPADMRARHDELARRIRLGDPLLWGVLDVLPGIAQPGDEKVVAALLYEGGRAEIEYATGVLLQIGTPAALAELEAAFPLLAKEAKPLPPPISHAESVRAARSKPVPETAVVIRVYEPYIRSLSNQIVALRQKLATASNQIATARMTREIGTKAAAGTNNEAAQVRGVARSGQSTEVSSAGRHVLRSVILVAAIAAALLAVWRLRARRP